MPESVLPTHEALLQLCAAAAPKPWHPKVYARESGVPRDSLDSPLNDLRLAGLMRLTEWEKGWGQGYVLTEFGEQVLKNPAALAKFREGVHAVVRTHIISPPEAPDSPPAPLTAFDRGEELRNALYYPEPPRVVPILILINMIAFAITFYMAIRADIPANRFASQGDSIVLRQAGALTAPDLVRGDWWRLITCGFLHFGALHLMLNMACLYSLRVVESLWGSTRFLVVYMLSILGGSCTAMIYHSPLDGVVIGGERFPLVLAGASGAVWGMVMSLVAWLLVNRRHIPPPEWWAKIQMLGTIILLNVLISFIPGISAAAHFGGGAVGFLTAILLNIQRYAVPPRRTAALVLLLLLPMLCIYALVEKMRSDDRWALLADEQKKRQRLIAITQFRQEVLPAIDRADAASGPLLDPASIMTDRAPEKREPDKVDAIRKDIKAARELVQDALGKLAAAKPSVDERLDAASSAGKDYMQALAELLNRFDQILEKKTTWEPDERPTIEPKQRHARQAWVEAKNQLQ